MIFDPEETTRKLEILDIDAPFFRFTFCRLVVNVIRRKSRKTKFPKLFDFGVKTNFFVGAISKPTFLTVGVRELTTLSLTFIAILRCPDRMDFRDEAYELFFS